MVVRARCFNHVLVVHHGVGDNGERVFDSVGGVHCDSILTLPDKLVKKLFYQSQVPLWRNCLLNRFLDFLTFPLKDEDGGIKSYLVDKIVEHCKQIFFGEGGHGS